MGQIKISHKQAQRLKLKKGSRLSPVMEKSCLTLIANESFLNAEKDIELLTGIRVPHSTQHYLGLNDQMELKQMESEVEELSVDGGTVKIRTPLGQSGEWKQYKAIKVHQLGAGALYKEDEKLSDWVNQQPLAQKVTCLGDGHDGVWNVVSQIASNDQRREILDWYHLMENLAKVGLEKEKLKVVKNSLWEGLVTEVIDQLTQEKSDGCRKFRNYLKKHQSRIPNYKACQRLGITIGSGQVESLIKQISSRMKIVGSQWKESNISQMLKLRCTYLNGDFGVSISA